MAAQTLTVAGAVIPATGLENASAFGVGGTLLGDDGPNELVAPYGARATLDGRGGDDELKDSGRATLRGGAGSDRLWPAPGDHADGGDGDDRLTEIEGGTLAEDGRRGTVLACGAGRDTISVSGLVVVPADCDTTLVGLDWAIRDVRFRGRTLRIGLRGNGLCGSVLAARAPSGRRVTGRARLPASASPTAWHHIVLPLRRGERRTGVVTLALTGLVAPCHREDDLGYASGTALARVRAAG